MKEAPSSTVPVPGTCWHKAPESIQYHGAINRTFSQLWCQLLATKSSDREKGCQDAWICAAPSTALFRRRHLEAWRKKRKGGDAVRCMGATARRPLRSWLDGVNGVQVIQIDKDICIKYASAAAADR